MGQSVLSREIRCKDLDLADHFKGWIDIRLQTLRFRLVGDDAIEHDFILEVDAAVDTMTKFAALNTRRDEKVVVNLPIAGTNVPWASAD